MGLRRLLYEFSQEASIPGLFRIFDKRRRLAAKIFWAVALVVCTALFVIETYILVRKYLSYPKTVETTLEFQILAFPAVTVCNINPYKMSGLPPHSPVSHYQQMFVHMAAEIDTMNSTNSLSEFCDGDEEGRNVFCDGISMSVRGGNSSGAAERSDTQECAEDGTCEERRHAEPLAHTRKRRQAADEPDHRMHLSMLQILSKARRDLEFMVGATSSEGFDYERARTEAHELIEDCSFGMTRCDPRDFRDVDVAGFGRCFTFNADGSKPNTTKAGATYGLRMLLNVRQDEYLPIVDTVGAHVVVHLPYEHPFAERGYDAMVGTRTAIGLTQIETRRLGSPYGNCTKESEVNGHHYDYFGNYTNDGCLYSCLQRNIIEMCGCGHFMYPLPGGGSSNDGSTVDYCGMDDKACVDDAEEAVLAEQRMSATACNCYQRCFEVNFLHTISQATFPSARFLNNKPCRGDAANAEECESEFRNNYLELDVYYEHLNYQLYNEVPSYPFETLLSDFGGQIGLWLGVSALGLAEFVSLMASVLAFLCGYRHGDVEKRDDLPADSTALYSEPTQYKQRRRFRPSTIGLELSGTNSTKSH